MRVIKFRFWDKEEIRWMVDGRAETNIYDFAFKHGMNWAFLDKKAAMERVEVVQFTGLLDKNGEEIFEGDIIRILLRRHMEDSVFANAEIRFENASFWFDAPKIGFTDCNWHFYNQKDREVIGNIYENPELLK